MNKGAHYFIIPFLEACQNVNNPMEEPSTREVDFPTNQITTELFMDRILCLDNGRGFESDFMSGLSTFAKINVDKIEKN